MSGHNWQVIPLTPQVHAAPEVGFTWNVARFALLGTEIVSFSKDFLTEWFWNSGAPPASGPRRPWPRRPWPKARARAGRDTTGEVKWRSIHVDFFVVLFFQVGPSAYALPVPLAPPPGGLEKSYLTLWHVMGFADVEICRISNARAKSAS